MIENLERIVPNAHNIIVNVRSIPDIKTPAGRGRAFIRCGRPRIGACGYHPLPVPAPAPVLTLRLGGGTHLGSARTVGRVALMEKNLAAYWNALLSDSVLVRFVGSRASRARAGA